MGDEPLLRFPKDGSQRFDPKKGLIRSEAVAAKRTVRCL
jgi:hypothetical protein